MADKEINDLTSGGAAASADIAVVDRGGNSRQITLGDAAGKDVTGADAAVVSGTAGTSGNLGKWNADGDMVDGPTPPSGTIVGTSDTQTLTNKTIDPASNTLTSVLLTGTENQGPLTGGAEVTSKSLGTKSSGTLTLDMADRPLQHYTNGGAHTLAPGAVNGTSIVDITNNASAGTITTSGWTKAVGSAFTTTDGHKFRCHCSVGNGGSLLVVQAMQ